MWQTTSEPKFKPGDRIVFHGLLLVDSVLGIGYRYYADARVLRLLHRRPVPIYRVVVKWLDRGTGRRFQIHTSLEHEMERGTLFA